MKEISRLRINIADCYYTYSHKDIGPLLFLNDKYSRIQIPGIINSLFIFSAFKLALSTFPTTKKLAVFYKTQNFVSIWGWELKYINVTLNSGSFSFGDIILLGGSSSLNIIRLFKARKKGKLI
jgi:hypothetical protein